MIIPAGYAQVNWKFGGSSCPLGAQVTCGVEIGATPVTPGALAAFLRDAWDDTMQDVQVSTCTHTSTLVKYGPTVTGPSAEVFSATVGSLGVNGIAPNVALLVSKVTAQGGRAGKGRFFMPGMTEADTTQGGDVDAAYLAAAQTAANELYGALEAVTQGPVVLHGPGIPQLAPTPITGFSVQARVATQRRRQRR